MQHPMNVVYICTSSAKYFLIHLLQLSVQDVHLLVRPGPDVH